nr:MAG TPA: WYL domain protein [Bacteriophage sp.]
MLYNLALDRILELAPAKDEPYYGNSNFDPSTFFDDIVGVTKGINQHPEEVRFWVNPEHAPYVLTKPIHKSQHLIEQREDGSMVFQITVVINHELQREILGFGDGIRVLYPASLVRFMKSKFRSGSQLYTEDI